MIKIISTEIVSRTAATYAVFTVPNSAGTGVYRVDVTNKRCDCPGWKFQRADALGNRKPCKHLTAIGLTAQSLILSNREHTD